MFGKLNKIDLLKKLFGSLEISNEVYHEVVMRGKELNAVDPSIIQEHINNNDIVLFQLNSPYSEKAQKIGEIYQIDKGEAETIALALQLEKKTIIIDEVDARRAASALGIKPIGCLGVLLSAYQKGFLGKKEVKAIVQDMESSKFRLSTGVLIEFWNLLEKAKKD